MNCDMYGWSMFSTTDEVKPFDGNIATGIYYVETDNWFPLKQNGWYYDDTVEKAIKHSIITYDNIKYQIKPSYVLNANHFEKFVKDVFDKFVSPKLAINGFIGILGKNNDKIFKTLFH